MAVISYLHFFAAITYCYLAFQIYRRNHSLPLSRASIGMCITFAIWSGSLVFVHNPAVSRSVAVLCENLGAIGWGSFPVFFVWQARLISKRSFKSGLVARLVYIALIATSLTFIGAQFWGKLFSGHVKAWFGWYGWWLPGWWSTLYLAYVVLTSLYCLTLVAITALKTTNRLQRDQTRLLFFAALIPYVLGVLTNIGSRLLFDAAIPPVADIAILVWAMGIFVAISRYHFLTITPALVADRIIETMADLLVLSDTSGNIVSVNNAAVKTLGYRPEQLVGKPLVMLVPQLADSTSGENASLTRKFVRYDECVLNTSNGKKIYVNLSVARLAGTGTICIAHDITREVHSREVLIKDRELLEHLVVERTGELKATNDELTRAVEQYRQVQEQLRSSEEHLRIVYESAPDAYYINDLSGKLLDGNRKAVELTGYKKEELIGSSFLKLRLLPADQIPRAIAALARGVAGKGTGPEEFVLRRKDGALVTVEISTYPVTIGKKKVVLGIARDMAGRREAQEALRRSEEKFRLTFENSRDAILWVNATSGVVINGNGAAWQLFGQSAQTVVGKGVGELLDSSDPTILAHLLGPGADDTDAAIVNLLARGAQGEAIPVEASSSSSDMGSYRLVQIVFRDVSERTRAQEERSQLQQQLLQAEKMKAIGELAGGIAHDFNNMLGAIAGYAEMIKGRLVGENTKLVKYVDGILSAAQRSAKLTEQLLAFARKGKVQLIPVDMHQILDEVLQLIEHTFDKRILIERQFYTGEVMVMADPNQLQNVVLNLAVNARDAMTGGGKMIFGTRRVVLDESFQEGRLYKVTCGAHVELCVRDTGEGMDAATIKRAFEPFFTTKEKGKGTGLGLSSVYGTVKSHNGYIEIASEPGSGTVVTVWLPLCSEQGAAPIVDNSKSVRTVQCTKTILVVDDEDLMRDLACEVIVAHGCKAVAFSGAEELLAYCRTRTSPADLVLLDMVMPNMRGEECFKRLQRIHPGLPVVLMSGFLFKEDTQRLLSQGVAAFLRKPFDNQTLIDTLEKILLMKSELTNNQSGTTAREAGKDAV